MAIYKLLTEEELPEQYKEFFDINEQWQEKQPNKTRTHKMRTMVSTKCPICLEWRGVAVNDVRNWIAGRRKTMPGTHRACKYTGRVVTGEGYVWIWMPGHPHAYDGKYVPEHILVMEGHVGRYLDRNSESVHHKDGDRQNNKIDNLQLRNRYHGKGQVWQCGDCGSHNIKTAEI